MKKILSLLLTIAIVFSLAACGQSKGQEDASSLSVDLSGETQSESQTSPKRMNGSNILVAYFSWADNAILAEDVDAVTSPSVIPPGNVQQLAGWVQEETGGELFSIRVTDPYPSDWDACLERANDERGDDARPELQENVGTGVQPREPVEITAKGGGQKDCTPILPIRRFYYIERHPHYQRTEELSLMRELEIQPEAWAPFAEGLKGMFAEPVLQEIAQKHYKTPAQVILRWNVQQGVIVIPKSVHKERMEENLAIWDFSLDDEDMAKIAALDKECPSMLDTRKISEVRRVYDYLNNPVLTSL